MWEGVPWWSRGEDSELPLLGARVLSLVRGLKSCTPHGAVKGKEKSKRIGMLEQS